MGRHAYLRISLRAEEAGDTYVHELRLDGEAIDAIVARAAGRLDPPRWAAVRCHVYASVESALLDWARHALKERVENDADVLALGLMNLENPRRRPPDE